MLGKSVGFDHYLLKPCDPRDVVRLLEPLRSSKSATAG
jgi:YesN/AraC family two-component response regulator